MTKRNAADEPLSASAAREYSRGETATGAADAHDENASQAAATDAETDAHAETVAPQDTEEWDDTPTALGLRAIFTFLSGAFLIFSMTRAPLSSFDPARLAQSYLLAFLILPLGIVWLFFAQSVRHVDYLKNQALNAWNYGWNFKFPHNRKSPDSSASRSALPRVLASQFLAAIALCVLLLPLLFLASRSDDSRAISVALFPVNASTRSVSWLPFLLLCAFCREWFFRGFLLFGIAQGFRGIAAPLIAIAVQAALFAAALGASSGGAFFDAANVALFFAGLLLGIVAWKQKSFAAPFFAHALLLVASYFLRQP